jgi:hypothetical protein
MDVGLTLILSIIPKYSYLNNSSQMHGKLEVLMIMENKIKALKYHPHE